MRVLLTTDSRDPSGIGWHMLGLAVDHRPALVFPEAGDGPAFAARAEAMGLEAHTADTEAFDVVLAEFVPDLLHVYAGIGWEAQSLCALGQTAGIPVVRTERLPWLITDPAQEVDYARAAACVEAFVAVSAASAQSWAPVLQRLQPGALLATIRNGVAPRLATRPRAEVRAELGLDDVPHLGASVAGRPVVVWGGGVVGLLISLFARRAGAEVLVVEPSDWRRGVAMRLGLLALSEEDAWRHANAVWHGSGGRGAEIVFQTRARSESLHMALRALRPQGTVIDMAFYQGGLDGARLGEEFHHNGLSIRCAQIGRMPRPLAAAWDRRRLALETLALLADEGAAIRRHLITHVIPFDESADFLRRLVRDRPEFLQIVFEAR